MSHGLQIFNANSKCIFNSDSMIGFHFFDIIHLYAGDAYNSSKDYNSLIPAGTSIQPMATNVFDHNMSWSGNVVSWIYWPKMWWCWYDGQYMGNITIFIK